MPASITDPKQSDTHLRKNAFVHEAKVSGWSPECSVHRYVAGLQGYFSIRVKLELTADIWSLSFEGACRPRGDGEVWRPCIAVKYEKTEQEMYATARPGRPPDEEFDLFLSQWLARCSKKVLRQWEAEAKERLAATAG